MKKNSISRFTVIVVTALFLLTTANAFAARSIQPVKTTLNQIFHKTVNVAYVEIYRAGVADTPYLRFTAQSDVVYTQVENALSRLTDLFHVIITFVNKENETVDEDDYYIDNRNYMAVAAIKYD